MKTSSLTKEVIYSIGCELEVILLAFILGLVIVFVLPKFFTFCLEKRKIMNQKDLETKTEKEELIKKKSAYEKLINEHQQKVEAEKLSKEKNDFKKDKESLEKEKIQFEKEKKSKRDIIEDLKFLVEHTKDKDFKEQLLREIYQHTNNDNSSEN